jgi:proton glutamate symport protein
VKKWEVMDNAQNKEELSSLEFPRFVTVGAVVGIVLGFALGALANVHPVGILAGIGAVAGPIGEAWTKALLLVVVPLIMCYLILAATGEGVKRAAKVGGVSLAVFVAMMIASAVYTVALAPPLIRQGPGDGGSFARAVERAGDLGAGTAEGAEMATGLGEALVGMIPDNVFEAAADGDLIGLILVSVLFGFALSRIGPQKDQVVAFVRAMRDAVFVATYWVILALPVGAFALSLDIASRTGLELAGVIGYYLLIHIGLLVGLTLLLYPFTALVAGGGTADFALAVWPAQSVAMTTRSSLASVPALVNGARNRLRLPEDVVGLTLPLAASTFKMNSLVSATLKLLFLAHLYGLGLDPLFILLFIGVQILTAPGVPGIPSGGYVMTLPLYVAVGIPVEGVILLKAMDGVPDIFKTLLNSTAYMSASVVVARAVGWRPTVRPGPCSAECHWSTYLWRSSR